ncbi:tRNA (adenine-N(6)-)-methyltransferase [Candidatus Pacearchaeota archaeon]|nr:tRNA (adenine-N(6)-)-methyltransferase [Candidatus Pacearchaeota archaeon]
MGLNKGYLTADRGKESDECLTPRYGVLPIIPYLKAREYSCICCPFDKPDSMFVRTLTSEGFHVQSSHIDEGVDFFDKVHLSECVVSNPPFSCKDRVLERLYKRKTPFAILLPQNSLQSVMRTNLFIKNGLEYLGFDRRICFYTNGDLESWKSGNHFASGYFCKDVLPEKLMFEKLAPIQECYNEVKVY